MKVIVDAMNALHMTGILPPELAGMDVPGLVDQMARGRWARSQVVLVCDGTLPPGQRAVKRGGISTVYAGRGREADDLIEELIERSHAPTGLLVVSSDRRIIKAARRRRCHSMSSSAFLRSLHHDHERATARNTPRQDRPRPQGKVSRKSVDEWRDRFELDEQDLAEFRALAEDAKPSKPVPPQAVPQSKPAKPKRTDQTFPEDLIAEAMRLLDEHEP